MEKKATIIPVAAGKGGVGKTLLTANLGIALAQLGHAAIVADMDLGGSNLFSFLGLPNRYPGIGDFLKARSADLQALLIQTNVTGLSYLPGDGKTPFMANIPFAQKQKLMGRIRSLPAEYVLLDLGSGSSFNTLDFFNMADLGLVVTTPERPAIMNMLMFLKNFLLRTIERRMARNVPVKNLLREMYKLPMEDQMASIEWLRQAVSEEDPEAGAAISEICRRHRPRIVFNMAQHPDDLKLCPQIDRSLMDILSLEADYFGFVFYDSSVRESVRDNLPLLLKAPDSRAADDIRRLAERVTKYWNHAVTESAALLGRSVAQIIATSA